VLRLVPELPKLPNEVTSRAAKISFPMFLTLVPCSERLESSPQKPAVILRSQLFSERLKPLEEFHRLSFSGWEQGAETFCRMVRLSYYKFG
jgi:hypothetical protein